MHDPAKRNLIRQAMNAPYLEREEELALARRWKERRDQQALNRITIAHMRLVISMAGRFRHFGLPAVDLIQEGHVGLLEAAVRFEPERQVRFSTYAAWWIRAAMQDFILRNWSIVRGGTSSAQKALFFNLRRLRAGLARERGDAPLPGEDGGMAGMMDFLGSDEPLPDEVVGKAIDDERRTRWLSKALSTLNTRELRIIRERRLSEDGMTLEALGATLGISKERVRQIESRALEKLRVELTRMNPDMMRNAA